ncbi:MAG: outer-membrane lipoprotein carrier protein LolA [Desulfuromonadales bacterium]|nr:outer-membrane lipoprotein carrier protein LolA [Desulfuromonadales bacterium]
MRPGFFAILMVLPVMALMALPARAAGLRDVISALETPFKATAPDAQRIQDYTAEFFQESRIASLDRLQRASGRVSVRFDYRRGQVPTVMFHWEYEEPTTQELVSNGKTLWVYLPENNQVIQSDVEMVSQAREGNPMTFLTGLGNLSRDFQISYAEPNHDAEGNYVLDLRPRRSSALLNRMVIVVDRDAVNAPETAGRDIGFKDETPAVEPPSRTSRHSEVPAIEPPTRAPRPGSIKLGPEPRGGMVFPILSTTVYDPNGNSTTIEFSDLRLNRGLSTNQFNFILPAGVEVVKPTGKEMGF